MSDAMIQLLPLALLGAVLGLDVVSFPQAMISRPLVAATAAATLLGDPVRGLLIGATLEMFALETLPFGASRYPEWGSAAVAGGALFTKAAYGFDAGRLTTSVLIALLLAWVGGWSMVQVRKLNAMWARNRHEAVARGMRGTVIGLQLAGLAADLVRGIVLTAIGLVVFAPLQTAMLQSWGSSAPLSRKMVSTSSVFTPAPLAWAPRPIPAWT